MSNLTLPDAANPGDPGHDTDHNLLVTALSTLNTEKLDTQHLQAKGDMVAASGAGAQARVPAAATNGQLLVSDSGQTPGVKWAPQPMRLSYYMGTAVITWTNQPAADTFWTSSSMYSLVQYVDLTGYTRARMHFYLSTIGNTTAKLMLRYASTWSSSVSSYISIGASSECETLIATTGHKDTGWVDLTALAKGPVWVAVVGTAGNAVADPVFASPIVLQFS